MNIIDNNQIKGIMSAIIFAGLCNHEDTKEKKSLEGIANKAKEITRNLAQGILYV